MKERILILLLLATVCSMQAQNIHMALRPDDLLMGHRTKRISLDSSYLG